MPKFLKSSGFRNFVVMNIVVLLAGCSWFSADKEELDTAVILSPLEVPPDR
jgi:hypothetical protein